MNPTTPSSTSGSPGEPQPINAQLASHSAPAPSVGTPPAVAPYPYGYGQPPIVIQTRGTFQRLLSWVGWLGFGFCGLLLLGAMSTFYDYFNTSDGIHEKYHSGAKFGGHKVAIINISGVIMEGDGFVKRQIDLIRDDESVAAVVVRVDSPGGTVTGSDYILHHLNKLRADRKLPIVVSMGGMAASGGYYVAMSVGDQEKSIYAEPTTTTGSIGVIIPHYDVSQLMARFDVKDDSIASHPRKQILSMTKPLSEEDREILKAYVNESFERFKEIVKQGRPAFQKDDEALTKLATGEIFTAGQAKRHGLVDEIGFIEDAIDRAIELAKLDKKQTRVVKYQRPPSLFDFGLASAHAPDNQLALLLELNSPRAYYLATSLPTLLTSKRAD